MTQCIKLKDPKAVGEELVRIEGGLIHRTTKEVHQMLINLQPSALKSQGLAAALQSLADKIKSTYSQNAIITMEENIHHLLTEDHAGRLHHTSGICIP